MPSPIRDKRDVRGMFAACLQLQLVHADEIVPGMIISIPVYGAGGGFVPSVRVSHTVVSVRSFAHCVSLTFNTQFGTDVLCIKLNEQLRVLNKDKFNGN